MTTVHWYFVSLTKYSVDEIPVLCMILGKNKKNTVEKWNKNGTKNNIWVPPPPKKKNLKQFSHFAYINIYHEPWFFLMDLFCYRTQ